MNVKNAIAKKSLHSAQHASNSCKVLGSNYDR